MLKNCVCIFSLLFVFTRPIESTVLQNSDAVQAQELFIDSDDAKLFCRTMGTGKPLVVLHGGPGLGQNYLLPQLSALAEHHFVIFYDQRGCGKSTGEITSETMDLSTYVKDLETLRKTFQCDKISLLGHSWGAFLALHYAIAYPDCVDKLIVSNSVPASSEDIDLFFQEWACRMAPYQEQLTAIENKPEFQKGDPKLHEQMLLTILRTYCHIPDHANLLNLQMSSSDAIRYLKINQISWDNVLAKPFSLYESLKNLRIPTLVLHGESDPVPSSTAKKIQSSILNAKYVELEKCGHFPYVEQSDQYFKLIDDFLNHSE